MFCLFFNRFDVCLLCWQPFDSRPSMSELLTTLKDILAGGKVRWPSKKDPAVGVAAQQPGESPSGRGRSGSSSLGHRPKRPAPIKPPSGGTSRSRPQKEDEQGIIISNLAAHSQEDPEIERDLVTSKSTSLSQDAGTSAYVDSQKKEKASKSHKQSLKRDLSSSTEPLLESSPSLSAEDDSKMDILPIPVVPPPPSTGGDGEVTTATEQKKRKHRKSGEFKNEGEGKQKSKAKRKRKTEHDMSEKKTSKSEEGAPQQQQQASVGAFKMMSEPSAEEGELPLPQEIAEAAAINEAVIAGAGVGDGGPGEQKDDFILEPPLRFSQSSVDYLDEFGDIDDIDDSGPLSFDFAPPTAPSDDELEEEKPHPPPILAHQKQTQQIHKPPAQQQSSEKKKSATESLEAKKPKRSSASSKPQKAEAIHEEMEDEWQGLDYPVKNPPLWRAAAAGRVSSRLPQEKGTAAGQTRLVFPRDQENEFDEFAHRDALEEPPDSEDGGDGVVLDEDVAALLW